MHLFFLIQTDQTFISSWTVEWLIPEFLLVYQGERMNKHLFHDAYNLCNKC